MCCQINFSSSVILPLFNNPSLLKKQPEKKGWKCWWDERVKGKNRNEDKRTFHPANHNVEMRHTSQKQLLVSNSLPQGAKICGKKGENLSTDVICISSHANEQQTNSARRRKSRTSASQQPLDDPPPACQRRRFPKKCHTVRSAEQKGSLSVNAIRLRRALIALCVKYCTAVGMKYGKRLN